MSDPPVQPVQPTQPQLSPDGKYYWDGQRWLPAVQTQLAPPPAYTPPVTNRPAPVVVSMPATNSLAVASLVFGIVSWVLCPLVSSIVAVICGHVAHSQIRRTGEGGSGLATAGLILGYLNIAGGLIFFFVFVAFFGGLFALLAAIGAATPTPSP